MKIIFKSVLMLSFLFYFSDYANAFPLEEDWYKSELIPWLEQNEGKSFSLTDKNIEKYHSFNVKIDITMQDNRKAKCSSTRIHKNWLISAAHCLDNIKDAKAVIKNKNGEDQFVELQEVFYMEGREKRLEEVLERVKRMAMGLNEDDIYDIAIRALPKKDDFLLIRIGDAAEESPGNTYINRIVTADINKQAQRKFFISAKYGGNVKDLWIISSSFEEFAKCNISGGMDILATYPSFEILQGDSGAGLLSPDGLYGITSRGFPEENYKQHGVYFLDEILTLMKNAMGNDFQTLQIITE
ncbi:hypothetical protein FACS189437_03840 [Bacteroidia bacterium]|nr:hypothetical protein FACS189437_03840 [Bacteroidia bacterium]